MRDSLRNGGGKPQVLLEKPPFPASLVCVSSSSSSTRRNNPHVASGDAALSKYAWWIFNNVHASRVFEFPTTVGIPASTPAAALQFSRKASWFFFFPSNMGQLCRRQLSLDDAAELPPPSPSFTHFRVDVGTNSRIQPHSFHQLLQI